MNEIPKYIFALLAVIVLLVVSMGELEKRQRMDALTADMRDFMAAGDRFPLYYGLGLCERIAKIERTSGEVDVVNCDDIRHAIATSK